jgi:hypothetical protein
MRHQEKEGRSKKEDTEMQRAGEHDARSRGLPILRESVGVRRKENWRMKGNRTI